MNPSVINGGGVQQQQPQNQQPDQVNPAQARASADGNNNSNNNSNNSTNSSDQEQSASHQPQPSNVRSTDPRAFPSSFSSAGRFPFDDSDDDMFGDLDMRARMNRIGGFDWGAHKRAGGHHHHHQFPDADSFFSDDFGAFPRPFGAGGGGGAASAPFDAFQRHKTGRTGAAGGGHRTAAQPSPAAAAAAHHHPQSPGAGQHDRSHFYDHLPEEFRPYFAENFGHSFPRMRAETAAAAAASSPPTPGFGRQHIPQQQQPQSHYPAQQQQHQPQQPQQQQQPPYSAAEPAAAVPKPRLCDAAIQTEDAVPGAASGTDLQQPVGLRNTLDLGQRSAAETQLPAATDRAQSAPPTEPLLPPSANSAPYQTEAGTFANTGSSMTPQGGQFQYPPTQSPSSATATGGERHVPIVVEGRQSTVPPPPPQRSSVPRPAPFTPHAAQVADRSGGGGGDGQSAAADVPQTPHTLDCINKIQGIQSDVVDLLAAIERFEGTRADKEYKYIDEMLTRNLLKLDTIDTHGRESIRLARKEAIHCIQTMITVLEGKAEQNKQQQKQQLAQQLPTAEKVAQEVGQSAEQSLEQKLAVFQSRSAEDVAAEDADAEVLVAKLEEETAVVVEPETHVSAAQIHLKPATAKPM